MNPFDNNVESSEFTVELSITNLANFNIRG